MFLVLMNNDEGEIKLDLNGGQPHRGGFNKGLTMQNGEIVNGIAVAPLGGAITPKMPMKVKLTPQRERPVIFRGIFHQVSHDEWKAIPPTD